MMDIYIPVDGHFISERFERMARIIQDYDEHLELQWIPPDARTNDKQPPYQIWDYRGNYVVFRFTETDALFPEKILVRLWTGDTTKHDVLAYLDAMDKAREAMIMKEWLDKQEERNDKTSWLMKTKKNFIKWRDKKGDIVKLDDQLRKLE